MSTIQPEAARWYAAQLEIESLKKRVQELGQMARDVNSRRVVELEAELAAMRAGGEPVAEMVPCHTPSGKRVAVISRFQHLPIGTKLYTHPQPAAQDAEPDMFWDADNREIFAYDIEEIVNKYDPGQIVSIECARRRGKQPHARAVHSRLVGLKEAGFKAARAASYCLSQYPS